MPKKLYAVTNIKVSNEPGGFFAAGSQVDTALFTKEALMELHDAGAVEVKAVDEEPEVEETPVPEGESAPEVEEPPAPVEEPAPAEEPASEDTTE